MKRIYTFMLLILILAAGCGGSKPMAVTQSAPTAIPNTLYVDPGKDLGPISSYVFGSNISLYAMIPANKLQEAEASHITVLRGPGGGWGETNDLQPRQLDLLLTICKRMGVTPVMDVRLMGGTPEAAAALVRYANVERAYGITYWGIGNEPDYEKSNGKNMDTTTFNAQWRAIALAMKAVDPKIKLMGPELSQWGTELEKTPKYHPPTPTGQENQDWMTDFLKANGDLVDIVSVHRYPMYAPSSPTPITIEKLRENTLEWEPMVSFLRDLIKTYTGRDLPIAFTEVNSDPSNTLGGPASPDSFYNAIWYADVLGRLLTQKVFMVNYWAIASSGGLGLLETNSIRPTYYVFQMYSHFGKEQVYASSGKPFVSIYAAKGIDGSLTIMVINLTDVNQNISLQIQGRKPGKAQVWLFDASHNAEDMGRQELPSGVLALPAQSISLYAIEK